MPIIFFTLFVPNMLVGRGSCLTRSIARLAYKLLNVSAFDFASKLSSSKSTVHTSLLCDKQTIILIEEAP